MKEKACKLSVYQLIVLSFVYVARQWSHQYKAQSRKCIDCHGVTGIVQPADSRKETTLAFILSLLHRAG